MPQPRKSKLNQVLIVEGTDDQHVIWALCGQFQLPQTFEVVLAGKNTGKDALLADFPVQIKNDRWKTVGIVIDADQDIKASWQAVRSRLIASGYSNVPKQPAQEGLILESEESTEKYLPRFGAWILPNNQDVGILEDLVRQMIPIDDPLVHYADEVLQAIESANLNRYSADVAHAKAFIHTWLAWQEKPGQPMGQALTARALEKDSAIASQFVTWMKQLFLETTAE